MIACALVKHVVLITAGFHLVMIMATVNNDVIVAVLMSISMPAVSTTQVYGV